MKRKILFILPLIGLLFSCDPGSQIRYSVVNKTSSDLNLTVTPPSGVGLGGSYDLKPNDEIIIYADEVLGYASDIIKHKPMRAAFLNCLTLTRDSIPLKIDIHNSSSWTAENIGDTIAMYRLIIKSDATSEKTGNSIAGKYLHKDSETETMLSLSNDQSFKIEYSDDSQNYSRLGTWQLHKDTLVLFCNKSTGDRIKKSSDTLKFTTRDNQIFCPIKKDEYWDCVSKLNSVNK